MKKCHMKNVAYQVNALFINTFIFPQSSGSAFNRGVLLMLTQASVSERLFKWNALNIDRCIYLKWFHLNGQIQCGIISIWWFVDRRSESKVFSITGSCQQSTQQWAQTRNCHWDKSFSNTCRPSSGRMSVTRMKCTVVLASSLNNLCKFWIRICAACFFTDQISQQPSYVDVDLVTVLLCIYTWILNGSV